MDFIITSLQIVLRASIFQFLGRQTGTIAFKCRAKFVLPGKVIVFTMLDFNFNSNFKLTLSALEGGQIDPHFFWAFITAKRPGQSGWYFFTFPVYPLTKDLTKKIDFFMGGTPPLAPQRGRPTKKRPPITAYDPIFFNAESFYTPKMGMLAKN